MVRHPGALVSPTVRASTTDVLIRKHPMTPGAQISRKRLEAVRARFVRPTDRAANRPLPSSPLQDAGTGGP